MIEGIVRVGPAPLSERAEQTMVPMRDRVRLATDVYLPEGDGPFPAVLMRLPYDKNSFYVFCDRIAERMNARGYALVAQDVRGKFRSEGETVAGRHEVNDGYDTIDWVVAQSWSDQVVGMFGDSYFGLTQWAAVASQHPNLKAIVPRVTSTELFPRIGYHPLGVDWLEGAAYFANYWVDNDIHEFELEWDQRPLTEVFEQAFAALGTRSKSWDRVYPEPEVIEDMPVHPFDADPIPVLHCVGWFDNLSIPHMRDYAALISRPDWGPKQYLYADSTDHENYHLADAPVAEEDDHQVNEAALDRMLDRYVGPALDFFDVFLRELHPSNVLPRVQWHLGHAGTRVAPSWPPPEAAPRTLLLAGDASDGRLSDLVGDELAEVSWTSDPGDLVPSAVTNSFEFIQVYPDESEIGSRKDVLVFTGEAESEPIDLAGPVTLELDLTCSAADTPIIAKLLDVDPEGEAHMIVRGQAPAREGQSRLKIDLGHTGYRLRPGHRLRLHVSASDFPLFMPGSGTGENPWLVREPRSTTQTLALGGGNSRLTVTELRTGAV